MASSEDRGEFAENEANEEAPEDAGVERTPGAVFDAGLMDVAMRGGAGEPGAASALEEQGADIHQRRSGDASGGEPDEGALYC